MKGSSSLKRIITLSGKEWLQILRDWRSLVLALVAPALLILLFGYALSVDVKNIPFAVIDHDKSSQSRAVIDRFSHTGYFTFTAYTDDEKDIDKLFNRGLIMMTIVIPPDFSSSILRGKQGSVQLIFDGTDSTSANIALGYASAICAEYNIDAITRRFLKKGIPFTQSGIRPEPRIWYNETLESRNYILPGLIALILAIICALIASLTISREYERGTLETLMSTPVRPAELLAGKIIPYLLIGIFDIMISILLGYFMFDLPVRGSFIELLLISILFLTGMSAAGILISVVTKTQVLSVQFSMVITYLPTFMLSGFMFPISNMPVAIQMITYLIPAKYLITVIKGIALKGIGSQLLITQIVFLSLFTVIILILDVIKISELVPYRRKR